MNKKLVWTAVIVVIIAAGAWYAMSRDEAKVTLENQTRLADDSNMKGPLSLRELVAEGRAVQCRIDDEGNKGTFYMANKKMRGDFSSVSNTEAVAGHMIVAGDTSYTWMEGAKTGFKMTISEEVKAQGSASQQVDLDRKTNYDCERWSEDDSFFEVPKDINFSDLTPMMNPKTETNNSGSINSQTSLKAAQCVACDSAPAESRAQCKATLGCN